VRRTAEESDHSFFAPTEIDFFAQVFLKALAIYSLLTEYENAIDCSESQIFSMENPIHLSFSPEEWDNTPPAVQSFVLIFGRYVAKLRDRAKNLETLYGDLLGPTGANVRKFTVTALTKNHTFWPWHFSLTHA
jgi:hypothetical protein